MKILEFLRLGLVSSRLLSHLCKNLHFVSSRLKNNLKNWFRLARRDLVFMTTIKRKIKTSVTEGNSVKSLKSLSF